MTLPRHVSGCLRVGSASRECFAKMGEYYDPGVISMDFPKMPVGFSMMLAQNEAAMSRFGSMTDSEKQAILSQAHGARSEKEMEQIVLSLISGGLKG